MYWVSIFAYCLRSLCQNEFLSGTYATLVPDDTVAAQAIIDANAAYANLSYDELCAQNAFPCSTMGDAILETIGISGDLKYKWGGPGFCLGFFAFNFALGLYALYTVRIQRNIGSSRVIDKHEDAEEIEEVIHMTDVQSVQKALEFKSSRVYADGYFVEEALLHC